MTTDEELLTGALDRTAGRITADRLRPLAEPETVRPPRRRRAIWNARLAPAAAAVGVALIVAVALLVTGGTRHGSSATGTPAPGVAGPPRYYAEVEGKFIRWHGPDSVEVAVRSTATGAAVARVPNPTIAGAAKVLPVSVAAGPDGRTFYAIYMNWGGKPGDFWIYRFRVTGSGAATRPAAVRGGTITGQDDIGNVGGFVVSPDGSRLALAVASVHDGSSQSSVASEIVVIDLRSGAHAVWRGGMERAGQTFGIESLSWTGGGRSLAYLGAWCPPGGISYGIYGGFVCSTLGTPKVPSKAEGQDVVREIRVTLGGGALNSGRVLRAPSASSGPLPVLVTPDGRQLITMVNSSSGRYAYKVVKTSIATGRVVSVLGTVSPVYPLFGGEYLAVDRTGGYVLAWMAGNATTGLPLHGWVHGGRYHQLAPTFPARYPGGWIQMTW
jgi:hypothetical protein